MNQPAVADLWDSLKGEIREVARRWHVAGQPGGPIDAPEAWIERVLQYQGLDDKSLDYLAGIVKQRGKLNIHHALHFVQIEDGVRARKAEEARLAEQVAKSPLLARLASRATK